MAEFREKKCSGAGSVAQVVASMRLLSSNPSTTIKKKKKNLPILMPVT
jgi:hypothetical protein